MSRKAKQIIELYLGIPTLTKKVIPVVITEHFVISFCLNISAYFKKCNTIHYDAVGQFISTYYWGCLLGALIGGLLTLSFKTTKISGIGLIILSTIFYCFFNFSDNLFIIISMFFIGLIGTVVSTSNMVSLIRSVIDNENYKLKVISLELILFNLSYSIITFILLDLSPQHISEFSVMFISLLAVVGILTLCFCQESQFSPITQIKKFNYKSFIPQRKNEFIILMSMVFCFGLIFSMVKVVFTPTLIDRFGSNMMSVTVASINPWVIFFIQPLIIDKIKNSKSILILGFGGLIVGISYLLFGIINSFIINGLILTVLTIGEMMFSPLSKHFNINLFKVDQEGIASGIWRFVFLTSGAVGSGLSGYIAEYYGSHMVWECCGLAGVICFMFSLFLYRLKMNKLNNNIVKRDNYEYL